MRFEHALRLPASKDAVWPRLMDIPAVARCVPGIESVAPLDGERYRGAVRVSVGPVRLRLEGSVTVTRQDEAAGTASMRLDATDRGIGGTLRADLHLTLAERDGGTELRMVTEATLAGRIGDLGQGIIKRKADQVVADFAHCLERSLGTAS